MEIYRGLFSKLADDIQSSGFDKEDESFWICLTEKSVELRELQEVARKTIAPEEAERIDAGTSPSIDEARRGVERAFAVA